MLYQRLACILLLFFFAGSSRSAPNAREIELLKLILNGLSSGHMNISREHERQVKHSYNEHQQFKDHSAFMLDPVCQNSHVTDTVQKYLKVERDHALKIQRLKEFLCMQFYQYFDIINLLSYDVYRNSLMDFKILKYNSDIDAKMPKIGVDSCGSDLSKYREKSNSPAAQICPWHWIRLSRENMFPFHVYYAKCDCLKCMGRTEFDSDKYQFSKCVPNYTLMPVLSKVLDTTGMKSVRSDEELWEFNLEEVPISCGCTLKIRAH